MQTVTEGAPRRTYLHGLDGLRAIAVALIIAYHLGFGWAQGFFWGVDLFFVLSGYLITSLLLANTPGTFSSLRQWWGKRVRRLVPAVTLVVVAVLVAFSTMPGITLGAFATMTWWANWHQILEGQSYWATDPSPLRHAWTLSIEEQFYLVWPLLLLGAVWVARRTGRTAAATVAVMAGSLAVLSATWAGYLAVAGADLNRIYLGTDTRAATLLLGCALGAVMYDRPSGKAARSLCASPLLNWLAVGATFTLVGMSVVLRIDERFTYTGGLIIAAAACTVLVITASRPGPLSEWLSHPVLSWVGVRSYGIYLWSWPIQVFAEMRLPEAPRVTIAAISVPLSLVAAWASLKLVEQPLRTGSGWAAELLPRRSAWMAGTTVVIASLVLLNGAAVRPVHEEVSATESIEMALAPPPTAPATTTTAPTTTEAPATTTTAAPPVDVEVAGVTAVAPPPPPPSPPPPTTAPLPPMRLMVAGDSLGFAAAYPSPSPAELPDFVASVDMRAIIGCGVLAGVGYLPIDDAGEGAGSFDCSRQLEAEQVGLSASPDWMVFFSGGWEHIAWQHPDGRVLGSRSAELRAVLLDQLIHRANVAAGAGTRTAFVAWVCPHGVNATRRGDYANWYNDVLREAAAAVPGSFVVEPTDRVCVGANAAGEPTEEKHAAFTDHHVEDRRWLWQEWLGPSINGRR